jgi:hypothetical protein
MGKKSMLAALAAIGLAVAMPALAANVSGVVMAPGGTRVAGINVIARNPKGATMASATSSANGRYTLSVTADTNCRFVLDTGATGFKDGGPVGAFVPRRGITLNWIVSPTARALAYARPVSVSQTAAVDPPSLLPKWAALAVGTGIVAGGTIGGYAAAGGFNGGSSHIASSSK